MITSLFRLARPKGTALLLIVPLTGYGFAHWDFGIEARRPLALACVLASWVLLSAGSLWLNAELDGDEGRVLFSDDARVSRPPRLDLWAYAALALATIIASSAGSIASAACAVCSVLAVMYSHPRTKWKARPMLGPMVNGVGYGMLSWIAGWSVAGVAMTARTAAAMMLFTTFVVGMSFAAQSYQREDDARRGYRTLVVSRGPAACLRVGIVCTRITMLGVAVLAAVNVYPRIVLLGLPLYAFAELAMMRWRRADSGGSPEIAMRFAMRMLAVGFVLVALAAVDALT